MEALRTERGIEISVVKRTAKTLRGMNIQLVLLTEEYENSGGVIDLVCLGMWG